jgi:5'-3' exonuclease
LLMGDPADNIAGLPHMTVDGKDKKIGPIAAFKLLEDCKTDLECFELIKKLFKESSYQWHDYRDDRPTIWATHMVSDMQLLWMRRKPDQTDVIMWLGELD